MCLQKAYHCSFLPRAVLEKRVPVRRLALPTACLVSFLVSFALGCQGEKVVVVSSATELEHKGPVVSLAFSPDSKMLAAGCADVKRSLDRKPSLGILRVWDMPSGTLRASLVHEQWVNSLAFFPDGTILVAGCGACAYDTMSKSTATPGMPRPIFVPHGSIRLWNMEAIIERKVLKLPWSVCSVAVSPDGEYLAAIGARYATQIHVSIWDTKTLSERGSIKLDGFPLGPALPRLSGAGMNRLIAFSPDSAMLAIGNNFGWKKPGVVHLCKVPTGEIVSTLALEIPQVVTNITFSPDGKRLAVVLRGVLEMFSLSGKKLHSHWPEVGSDIGGVVFSKSGATVATCPGGGDTPGCTIRNAYTGSPLVSFLSATKAGALSVALSSDGQLIARGDRSNKVKFWRVPAVGR